MSLIKKTTGLNHCFKISIYIATTALISFPGIARADKYQAPITITHGGTYSGNWKSNDSNVPAVTIKTSEPVTINYSKLQGRGHLIDAYSTFVPINLTVRNTKGYSLNPNAYGQSPGRFLIVSLPVNIVVENCYMEGTTGISLYDGSQYKSARIRYNRARNIDGRKSNGNGGFLSGQDDFNWAQFVQLNHLKSAGGVEIAWNEVINEPDKSRPEENINLYFSSGTSSNAISIHDNYIQGAYPVNPTQAGYSGGGMMLGDTIDRHDGDDAGFVKAYNNQIVGTTNQGISITGGHDIESYNNRIISSGLFPDGTPSPAKGAGVVLWDENSDIAKGQFYNNSVHDNTIGWLGTSGRNDTWFPNCEPGKCNNNTSLPDPITLDTEKAEYQTWQNKLSNNNVTIGPNF